MSETRAPMVGIVVVHYGRPDRTDACLDAISRSSWPAARRRVVLVDNSGDLAFCAGVSRRHPDVSVVRSGANVGFPAACNLGIAALHDVLYIALLNNDAIPEPGWMEPLVEAIERTGSGAVTPKVLLEGRHTTIDLRLVARPSPPGDWRELGVQLSGARCGDNDVSGAIRLVRGFWGWEYDATTVGGRFAWSQASARAQLPVADDDLGAELSLRLSSPAGRVRVEVVIDEVAQLLDVGPRPEWFDLGPSASPCDVVNNAGTYLLPDGSSRDRGYLEPDRGQLDEPMSVFGWSGTAVLLSKAMLDDIGSFDERLFLFYEDVDLSIRGRLRGWTYRFEPSSIVRHRHAGSVGEDSAISRHLTSRNRILVLAKVAPRDIAAAALGRQLHVVAAAVRNDLLARVRHRRRPTTRHVIEETRILVGALQRLPVSLTRRRTIQRGATISPEALWCETGSQRPPSPHTAISQVRGRIWEP